MKKFRLRGEGGLKSEFDLKYNHAHYVTQPDMKTDYIWLVKYANGIKPNAVDAESPAIMQLSSYNQICFSGFPDSINKKFGQCLEAGGLNIKYKNESDYRSINNGNFFKIQGSPWFCDRGWQTCGPRARAGFD